MKGCKYLLAWGTGTVKHLIVYPYLWLSPGIGHTVKSASQYPIVFMMYSAKVALCAYSPESEGQMSSQGAPTDVCDN